MSDLQCPASFVLLTPETARSCDLRDMRLSRVVSCDQSLAQRLAAKDGCEIEATQFADGAALAARIAVLADSYRGEQVAVVASAAALCEVLRCSAAPTQPVLIAVDSDGWNVLSE